MFQMGAYCFDKLKACTKRVGINLEAMSTDSFSYFAYLPIFDGK
jgi:hypothetical protein